MRSPRPAAVEAAGAAAAPASAAAWWAGRRLGSSRQCTGRPYCRASDWPPAATAASGTPHSRARPPWRHRCRVGRPGCGRTAALGPARPAAAAGPGRRPVRPPLPAAAAAEAAARCAVRQTWCPTEPPPPPPPSPLLPGWTGLGPESPIGPLRGR